MEDVLRSEVLGESRLDKMGEEDTLMDGMPAVAMSSLASTEVASDILMDRKGGEMLVMGKIPPSCRIWATDKNQSFRISKNTRRFAKSCAELFGRKIEVIGDGLSTERVILDNYN